MDPIDNTWWCCFNEKALSRIIDGWFCDSPECKKTTFFRNFSQSFDDCCDCKWKSEKCCNKRSWGMCCAGYISICFSIPIFIVLLVICTNAVLSIILFAPPLIPLIIALPMMRGKKYDTFASLERFSPTKRADPDQTGHVGSIFDRGWFRCFLISLGLTSLGWFPGVVFSVVLVIIHLVNFCKRC